MGTYRQYLDGIAHEINEQLQETGQVPLGDLGKRFGLTSDFVHQVQSPFPSTTSIRTKKKGVLKLGCNMITLLDEI